MSKAITNDLLDRLVSKAITNDLLDRLEDLKILQADNGYLEDAQLISDTIDKIEHLQAEVSRMRKAILNLKDYWHTDPNPELRGAVHYQDCLSLSQEGNDSEGPKG